MKQETKKLYYMKEGQAQGAVGAVIALIVGVGVSVLILIFVGVLGGQAYDIAEDDIDAISNVTIRNSVRNSIVSGFEALENTGDYLPLIVLGIVIFIVLGLVLGMTAFSGGVGGGSAL